MTPKILLKNEREFKNGVYCSTGYYFKITIETPVGSLAGFLFDEEMLKILPEYPYEIFSDGHKLFDGRTDENGYFFHSDLPSDYYELKANGESYIIPTLTEEDSPYQLRILGEPQISEEE